METPNSPLEAVLRAEFCVRTGIKAGRYLVLVRPDKEEELRQGFYEAFGVTEEDLKKDYITIRISDVIEEPDEAIMIDTHKIEKPSPW